MRKNLLLLSLFALLCVNVNASNRKWDFTKWSEATVANLMAGSYESAGTINPTSGWSDVEKKDGTAPTAESKNNCFWELGNQGNSNSGVALTANGVEISELSGLLYVGPVPRNLAIAVNYPTTSLGTYSGGAYLWLGGSKKNYFVIPDVKPGAIITIGEESHKPTDARGVELYIVAKGSYSGTKGTKLKSPEGEDVGTPTVFEEKKWLLPEDGLTDTPNEDGSYDVLIYNTNGCHLYYINVLEDSSSEEAKKVAWISSTDDPENSDIYRMMAPTDGYDYTAISSNATDVTVDSLRYFDAVVISTDVTSEDALYSVLEQNIAYVPMVNLNTNIFGYTSASAESSVVTASTPSSGLYNSVNEISLDDDNFEYAQLAVNLPERFANDVILGTNGTNVIFHQHGSSRNIYMLMSSPADAGELSDLDGWASLFANALSTVAMTKRDVSAAASPAASMKYINGQTTVTLSSGTSGSAVYYSLDGENYERYTDALSFTEPATIYSYAEAEGYTTSSVATHAVDIQTQISSPVISQSHSSNSTTVSISSEEGSTIYYSFVNTDATSGMAVYTEPVTVSEPTTVYAVATSAGKLTSEISSQEITIDSVTYETIRLDTLSHMNANVQEYYTNVSEYCTANYGASGTSSAFYIFGKSSWDYYKTDETGERIKKDSTLVSGESGDVYEYTYEPNPESLRIIDFQNGWVLKSYGQPACYEGIDANARVGNGEAGRSADNVLDLISGAPSKGLFDFNGKKSGDPNSLSIETTVKYAGPFDIVTFLGNGSTSSMDMKAQVSTDGETWQTVGQLEYSANQRYWKRTRLHYEGTDEVYVRIVGGGSKPQLYDVILLNNGELSKQYGKNLAGDVNGDGVVTMADANAIVNYFLADDATRASMKDFNVNAANVNGDEGITMADANAVVNMFLSNQ